MQHLFMSFCMAATLAPAASPNLCGDENVVEIVFGQNTENTEHSPHRSPTFIPISGYVDTVLNLVFLNFSSPCGTVEASFCNLSTGGFLETTVNGTGNVMIPAILSAGAWQVTFTLSSGAEYIGEFEL